MRAGRAKRAAAAPGRQVRDAELAATVAARGAGQRCTVLARLRAGLALLVLALLVLALAIVGAAAAEPRFPPLTGRIVDEAGLLSSADRQEILETLRALEAKSTDQIVVYTTRSLQGYEIEDFGYRLGRAWKIGQEGVNNGIVLIVAPSERKVRIEVGRGLEPQMTDLMSGLIVNNVVLPAFRRGDFAGGIKAAVRDIRDVLLGDAEEVKRRAAAGAKRSTGQSDLTILLFFLLVAGIVLFVAWSEQQQARGRPAPPVRPGQRADPWARRGSWPDPRRSGDGGGGIIVIPTGGSSGGWDGGGSSDPDAGWSGGGGDFGGGGASGSW